MGSNPTQGGFFSEKRDSCSGCISWLAFVMYVGMSDKVLTFSQSLYNWANEASRILFLLSYEKPAHLKFKFVCACSLHSVLNLYTNVHVHNCMHTHVV